MALAAIRKDLEGAKLLLEKRIGSLRNPRQIKDLAIRVPWCFKVTTEGSEGGYWDFRLSLERKSTAAWAVIRVHLMQHLRQGPATPSAHFLYLFQSSAPNAHLNSQLLHRIEDTLFLCHPVGFTQVIFSQAPCEEGKLHRLSQALYGGANEASQYGNFGRRRDMSQACRVDGE